MTQKTHAAPPAPQAAEERPLTATFEFDRYINGRLMAEGLTIEKATTFGEAATLAAKIAARGPNNEVPVLVVRSATPPASGKVEAEAENPDVNEQFVERIATKLHYQTSDDSDLRWGKQPSKYRQQIRTQVRQVIDALGGANTSNVIRDLEATVAAMQAEIERLTKVCDHLRTFAAGIEPTKERLHTLIDEANARAEAAEAELAKLREALENAQYNADYWKRMHDEVRALLKGETE